MPAAQTSKYLYVRLGAERFQKLCGALVVSQMTDVEVFPTGQSDGGRDITAGKRGVVLQVKFTRDRIRKPVTWLNAAIEGEDAKIRRLVKLGCERYILMTNIEGSASPDRGDRDLMVSSLKRHEDAYGIPMSAMWCSDIDAWVDLAGTNLKLSYVDMLAGSDALVAILQSTQLEDDEKRERDFLCDYVATQWQHDRTVKFTQIELKSNLLTDLFVDVTATRVRAPRKASSLLARGDVGGLASHILAKGAPPFTLVEGVPGQGKSTASQYICQAYRAQFQGRDLLEANGERCPSHQPDEMRLPIRIDLADYALWISGIDPLTDETSSRTKPAPRVRADIEQFLVKHFNDAASGYDYTLAQIRVLLDRFATQVVFDGLDEVANPKVRTRVVTELEAFISRRAIARRGSMHVLITTRPNSSGLAEPDADRFEKVRLNPLEPKLRKRYLRRWASAQGLEKLDLRRLERTFHERTAAPHVAQLANNPMQLALLLHLIKTKGQSLPTERTALYRQYMELFLDREVEKSTEISPVVKKHRKDIEEAAAYIGWYMQGRAEIDAASTRLSEIEIVRVMSQYLAGLDRQAPVKEIFEALNQRVWVLTSKQVGTYEFDVQPIREYVTARFLHDYAETRDGRSLPTSEVLTEMLSRPYWANTARFLAGHFQDANLADLADVITEKLADQSGQRQTRATVRALLADGVFKSRPKPQGRLADALADDVTVALLQPDDASSEPLAEDFGGRRVAARLIDLIEEDPAHPANLRRGRAAASVGDRDQCAGWWVKHMVEATGTVAEADWLRIGYAMECGGDLPADAVGRLTLVTGDAAAMALAAGLSPVSGGTANERLLQAVLSGMCTYSVPSGVSEAADLLTVFSPHVFRLLATGGTIGSGRRRTESMNRLRSRNPAFESAFQAMRGQKSTKGTTTRWVNTAVELANIYGGPRWLFTEIAATALILDSDTFRTGGTVATDRSAFGPDMHYGTWLSLVRTNAGKTAWWKGELANCSDPQSQAAWALSAAIVAPEDVLSELLSDLDTVIAGLSEDNHVALLSTSQRLGTEGLGRRLRNVPNVLDLERLDTSPATRLLLAHHSAKPEDTVGSDPRTLLELSHVSAGTDVAAAAATRVAAAAPIRENLDLVVSFGTTGGADLPDVHLPDTAVNYILDNAGLFPSPWVARAEQVATAQRPTSPLRTYADATWNLS